MTVNLQLSYYSDYRFYGEDADRLRPETPPLTGETPPLTGETPRLSVRLNEISLTKTLPRPRIECFREQKIPRGKLNILRNSVENIMIFRNHFQASAVSLADLSDISTMRLIMQHKHVVSAITTLLDAKSDAITHSCALRAAKNILPLVSSTLCNQEETRKAKQELIFRLLRNISNDLSNELILSVDSEIAIETQESLSVLTSIGPREFFRLMSDRTEDLKAMIKSTKEKLETLPDSYTKNAVYSFVEQLEVRSRSIS